MGKTLSVMSDGEARTSEQITEDVAKAMKPN
jgi:hypothetical protein